MALPVPPTMKVTSAMTTAAYTPTQVIPRRVRGPERVTADSARWSGPRPSDTTRGTPGAGVISAAKSVPLWCAIDINYHVQRIAGIVGISERGCRYVRIPITLQGSSRFPAMPSVLPSCYDFEALLDDRATSPVRGDHPLTGMDAGTASITDPSFVIGDSITYYGVDHRSSLLRNVATWELSRALLPCLRVLAGNAARDSYGTFGGPKFATGRAEPRRPVLSAAVRGLPTCGTESGTS
jgi:hypothetical protein